MGMWAPHDAPTLAQATCRSSACHRLVSVEAARALYRVAVDGLGVLDEAATALLRAGG